MKLLDCELRAMKKPMNYGVGVVGFANATYRTDARFNAMIDELLAARRFIEVARDICLRGNNSEADGKRFYDALDDYDKATT